MEKREEFDARRFAGEMRGVSAVVGGAARLVGQALRGFGLVGERYAKRYAVDLEDGVRDMRDVAWWMRMQGRGSRIGLADVRGAMGAVAALRDAGAWGAGDRLRAYELMGVGMGGRGGVVGGAKMVERLGGEERLGWRGAMEIARGVGRPELWDYRTWAMGEEGTRAGAPMRKGGGVGRVVDDVGGWFGVRSGGWRGGLQGGAVAGWMEEMRRLAEGVRVERESFLEKYMTRPLLDVGVRAGGLRDVGVAGAGTYSDVMRARREGYEGSHVFPLDVGERGGLGRMLELMLGEWKRAVEAIEKKDVGLRQVAPVNVTVNNAGALTRDEAKRIAEVAGKRLAEELDAYAAQQNPLLGAVGGGR